MYIYIHTWLLSKSHPIWCSLMWFGSRTLIFKSGMLIHLYGCHCQVSLRVFFSLSSRQVIDAFNELLVNNVPPGVRWSGVTPNSWHHGSEHRRMPPWMLAIWSFFGNDDQHFSEPLDLGAPYFRPHFDRKSRVAQVGHHSSRRQYQVGQVGIESHLFIDVYSQKESIMVILWLSISRRVSMARDIFLVFFFLSVLVNSPSGHISFPARPSTSRKRTLQSVAIESVCWLLWKTE